MIAIPTANPARSSLHTQCSWDVGDGEFSSIITWRRPDHRDARPRPAAPFPSPSSGSQGLASVRSPERPRASTPATAAAGGLGAQVEHRPLEPVGLFLDGRRIACRGGGLDFRQELQSVAEEESCHLPEKPRLAAEPRQGLVKVEEARNAGTGGRGSGLGAWSLEICRSDIWI